MRVAERHQIRVHLVSNSGMFGFHGHPLVTQIVVSDGADVADDWIAGRISAQDIVVTQDIPLADRCIKKDARAIRPNGKILDKHSIGMSLATRDLMTDLRSAGETTGGPRAFSKQGPFQLPADTRNRNSGGAAGLILSSKKEPANLKLWEPKNYF